jgi:hypothetical protein
MSEQEKRDLCKHQFPVPCSLCKAEAEAERRIAREREQLERRKIWAAVEWNLSPVWLGVGPGRFVFGQPISDDQWLEYSEELRPYVLLELRQMERERLMKAVGVERIKLGD